MRDQVNQLLEDAAAAGRTSPPPADELARYGHAPVPPTLRCQGCGRWLALERTGTITIEPGGLAHHHFRWIHVADEHDAS